MGGNGVITYSGSSKGIRVRTDNRGLKINPRGEAGGASKPATYAAAHLAKQLFGGDLLRFGAFRDASHIGIKRSRHNTGEAFDFTPRHSLSQAEKQAMATRLAAKFRSLGMVDGKDFFIQYEWKGKVNRNGSVSSGDHIHVEIRGDGHRKILQAIRP